MRKQKFAKDTQCWIEKIQTTAIDSETYEQDLWQWVTDSPEGHALKEQNILGFVD
jgi:hypothetical protein